MRDADEHDGDDHGEVRRPRRSRVPQAPTCQELEDYLPMLLPYREWCTVCVRAAGNHDPRHSHDQQEHLGVTISLDYAFFGSIGEDNMEASAMPTVLILHDDTAFDIWALQGCNNGLGRRS